MKKIISLVLFTLIISSVEAQLIISSNTTWSTNQTLTQPVKVNQGATLTINPGITISVLFIDNNSDLIGDVVIDVKGSLIVNGDACNKVQFKPFQTTTNKQYWTGINLDTTSTNNSINGAVISYAKNGIIVENSNLLANGVEINNCKTNGILTFGSSSILNLNNCTISNCDEEGAKISNSTNCQLKHFKSKNNGTTGLMLNSTTITINNSVFYNNSKSGIFTLGSTININNSISRKNIRMGICLNNSSFTGNYLDIDSNSVDGVFIGGSSTLNLQNSSISRNTGFGMETSEYIFNSDFGNISITGNNPVVIVNGSNFKNNHNTSVIIPSTDILNMQPSSAYMIGNSWSGPTCGVNSNGCNVAGLLAFDDACNNQSLSPNPIGAWHTYTTLHIPFGFFVGFNGTIGINNTSSAWQYRPKYGISEVSSPQNPFWEWSYNATNINNTLSNAPNCYPMNIGTYTISDKIGFMAAIGGSLSASNVVNNTDGYTKYAITQFYFQFGGYDYRSLVNNTTSTDNLTGNFWDTISPTNVINSVGAVLNINGFLINEIASSHSSLTNSFIYNNLNYFELEQNNTTFCTGANNILIAPSGNYTYSWMNGVNSIINNNDSLQISANGTYSVSISGSCTALSFPTSVTLSSGNPISIAASGPTTFCAGGSVTLTSPSSSGNLWSNGATTQSIIVNSSGSYSLTVSNTQGCPSVSQTIQVSVTSLPSAPVISSSGNTTFCANGSVTLSSNLSGNLIWSNSQTTQSILVNTSGTYSAQIISNGCTSLPSNSILVTVISNPNNSVTASGSTTFCQGSTVTLNAINSTGNSYQWFNNNVLIPNATNSSYTINSSGNYTVSITNGNCTSTSLSTTVTVNQVPSTPVINASGNTTFCQGNNVTLSSNLSNVIWSNGATTQSIIVSLSGNYSAQSSINGCVSPSSNLISVNVNSAPSIPSITPSGPTTFCSGGNVTLTSSSSINNLWSNNSNSQSIVVSNSGNYTVTVSNINGCSSTSQPISITVNPIPNAPIISANGSTTFCSGGSVALSSNIPNGNLWSNNNSNQTINVTTSGSYSSTVTQNGCVSPSSNIINITVNQTPSQPLITINGSTNFCSGQSSILSSSSTSGNLWSTGETSQSITVTNSGVYSVQVSSNGCSNNSTPITITVNPSPNAPTIIASGPTTFCQGSNVILTTDASNGVVWTASNGNQYPVDTLIVQSNQSNIFATVTLNGCTSPPSQSVSTTVLPIVTPTFNQVQAICSGGNINLPITSNNNISGTWTPVINNTTTTTYTFTPNTGQCANTATMTVTVNQLPTVTLASFNSVCDTAGIVNLTGGSPAGGTYSGTSVSNNSFNTSVGIGSYPITYSYTNSNGCSSTATQNLVVISCAGSNVIELIENGIVLYPNPTLNVFTIETNEDLTGKSFIIHDVSGRVLLTGTLQGSKTTIQVSSLSTGSYYFNLPETNQILKFIKQ